MARRPQRSRGPRSPRPTGVESPAAYRKLVLESPVPVLVDVHADWCAPCRALAPRLSRLLKELDGRARIVQLDAEQRRTRSVVERLRVSSLPTWVLFDGGREVLRSDGPRRLDRVETRLRQLAGTSGKGRGRQVD